MVEGAHLIAHIAIFVAYVAAMSLVPQSFKRLMRVRVSTQVAGAGFFLLCGLTHFSLVINANEDPFFVITDHLQAVAIWAFLVLLASDLARAGHRLTLAFAAMRANLGDEVGNAVAATIEHALKD